MAHVAYDEIPLSEERRVYAIIKRLRVPHLAPELLSLSRNYWERYFLNRRTTFIWRDKVDIWLTITSDTGMLRRVVISGLNSQKDAELLRSEVWRFRADTKQVPAPDDIERLADEVVEGRREREYSETFQHCIRDIRHYFKWSNGAVVEADGKLLPISEMRLRPDDVELLRRVYTALPRPIFQPTGEDPIPVSLRSGSCPLCGGTTAKANMKEAPLKSLKSARKKISNEDFIAWVNARLTGEDKRGNWMRAIVLFEDYAGWIESARAEQTDGDHAESKAAVLSQTAWGKIMGTMYAKRRDGKNGFWYNVRLKKR